MSSFGSATTLASSTLPANVGRAALLFVRMRIAQLVLLLWCAIRRYWVGRFQSVAPIVTAPKLMPVVFALLLMNLGVTVILATAPIEPAAPTLWTTSTTSANARPGTAQVPSAQATARDHTRLIPHLPVARRYHTTSSHSPLLHLAPSETATVFKPERMRHLTRAI